MFINKAQNLNYLEKFKIKNITCIHDTNYSNHDVLGTMMSVQKYMTSEVIISYTDIVFDEKIINSIKNSNQDINIAVEMDWKKAYVGRTEHPIEEAANVLIKNQLVKKIGLVQMIRLEMFCQD